MSNYVDINYALLCVDCDVLFPIEQQTCPVCCSKYTIPLWKILNPDLLQNIIERRKTLTSKS